MTNEDRRSDDETSEQPVQGWEPDAGQPAQPTQQTQPTHPTEPSQAPWQPPPPRGWTPPAQQGWYPPPQQGWTPGPGMLPMPNPYQQPPQWGSGYPGQSPYWSSPPRYGSSPLAVIAGILLLLVGVLLTLFGLLMLAVGMGGAAFLGEMDPFIGDPAAVAAFILVFAFILLSIGILEIVASIGVFVHKGWARWLGIVMAAIGLVFGFLLLFATFMPPAGPAIEMLITIVWLAGHGFVVAALAVAGEHFRPVYPPPG